MGVGPGDAKEVHCGEERWTLQEFCGAGPGQVEWLDGSRDPVGLDLAPTQAQLRSHGLHLSLRYEL